jgi:hypothetical protein
MQSGKKKKSILDYRNLIIIGRDATAIREGKTSNIAGSSYTEEQIFQLNQRHWCHDGRYDGNLNLENNYFMPKQIDRHLVAKLERRLPLLNQQAQEKQNEFTNFFCSAETSDAQRMLWLQNIAITQLATAFNLTVNPENSDECYRMFDSIGKNNVSGRTRPVKSTRILLEHAAYYGSTWACHMIIKGLEKDYFKEKDFNGYGVNDFLLLHSRNFQFLIVYPENEVHNPQSKIQQFFHPPAYAEYLSYWNQFNSENIHKKSGALITEFQILYNELIVLFAAITSITEAGTNNEADNIYKHFFSSKQHLLRKEIFDNPATYQLIIERDKLADCLTKLAPAMFNLADAFHSENLTDSRKAAADMNVIGPQGTNHLTTQLDRVLRNVSKDLQCFGATSVEISKKYFTDQLNNFMHKAANSRTCQLDPNFSFGTAMALLNAYKKAVDGNPSKSMFYIVRNKRNKERAPEIFWGNLFEALLEPNTRGNVANEQLVDNGLFLYVFFSLKPNGPEALSTADKTKITNFMTSKLADFSADSLEGKLCSLITGPTQEIHDSKADHTTEQQQGLRYPTSPGITMMQPAASPQQSYEKPTYNSALLGEAVLSATKK